MDRAGAVAAAEPRDFPGLDAVTTSGQRDVDRRSNLTTARQTGTHSRGARCAD